MRSTVGIGKTIEEAVQHALQQLGARPEEVELRKLEEGSSGIMGQGFRPFRVRATWRDGLGPAIEEPTSVPAREDEERIVPTAFRSMDAVSAPRTRPPHGERGARSERGERGGRGDRGPRGGRGERGDRPERERPPRRPYVPLSPEERFQVDEAFLARVRQETAWLLERMGFDAAIEIEGEGDEVLVSITSEGDEALLTGRRGDTRVALTQVLSRLVNPKRGPGAHLMVDVNGFWKNRREGLRERAKDLAARALESGEEVVTEPLASEERRIIHRTLGDDARVITESYGDGALKRVAIRPAEPVEPA